MSPMSLFLNSAPSQTSTIYKATIWDNYFPISLLSSLSKILEKMVSIQLVKHLDCNNLLYENQLGFQRAKSTEHNLLKAVNYKGDSINNNKFCWGVV
jgi:hypothetical protein